MTAHTWADGFGVWHVRISRHAAGPLIAARGALQRELLARESASAPVAREVWMHPVRVEDLDTDDTIVWREGEAGVHPDGTRFAATVKPTASEAVPGGTLWVCSCCLFASEGDGCPHEHKYEPWGRERDTDITKGLDWSDHEDPAGCERKFRDCSGEGCDCERIEHSSRICDGCGDPSHGERHAYTWWETPLHSIAPN